MPHKREKQYEILLTRVCSPLMNKINAIQEREIRDYFKITVDAAEQSLRGILFMAPSKLEFESQTYDKNFWEKQMEEKSAFFKQLTKEEIGFWLRKVTLALMSYSYHFYDDSPEVAGNSELARLVDSSYEAYWQVMFDVYNRLFGERIGFKEINHYASGLKEDSEMGYSEAGGLEKPAEMMVHDCATIGRELLEKIWDENINAKVLGDLKRYKPGYGMEDLDPMVKKIVFVGDRIWQAYAQIVQPFLAKLLKDY